MRKKKKQRKKKNVLNRILGFLLALVLLAAGTFLAYRFIEISDGDISIRFPDIGGASEKDFAVYYVDVGQGDAAVVVCDGKTLVIDGGTDEGGDALCSYMRNTLKTEQVDFMIATHPHADHIGGLSDVLREYTVKKLYSSVDVYDSRTFERMAQYAAAQNLGITVAQAGQSFLLGRAKVEFLAPLGIYDDINDISRFQFVIQRNDLTVYFCSNAFISYRAMDTIGKVERRCPCHKVFHVAFRCKHKNGIRK